MNALTEASSLEIGWNGQRLAGPLDLQLAAGELVALLGANGSGKSTLLRTLAGLIPPVGGALTLAGTGIDDMPLSQRARHLALVPSSRPPLPGLTGRDLVALGRTPHRGWGGDSKEATDAAVSRALSATGSEGLADRSLDTLSDGEFQRLALARALAQETKVILLDEPTAHLDLGWKVELLVTLRRVARERQIGIVVSSHDLDIALRLVDRLWIVATDGGFHSGVPEALALDGRLDSLIPNDNACFDIESGQWVIGQSARGHLRITGSGPRRFWTERLCRRLGWMSESQAGTELSVEDGIWKLRPESGETETIPDFEALARALDRLS